MSAYMGEYERRFPELSSLMVWMNLDWKYIFDWEGAEPNYEAVVDHYKAKSSTAEIKQATHELEQLLALQLGEEELRDATEQMDAAYYAPGNGQTYREWLEAVLSILKKPQDKARAMRVIG